MRVEKRSHFLGSPASDRLFDVEVKQLFRFERRNLSQLIDELAVFLEHRTQRSRLLTFSIQVSGVIRVLCARR